MSDCIFCKIAKGEIPSDVVYDDENVLGFKDINPAAPVHILFVPKKHLETFDDIASGDFDFMTHILKTIQEVARKEGVNKSGYRIVINTNKDAGQEVFHIHAHLIGGKRLGKMA